MKKKLIKWLLYAIAVLLIMLTTRQVLREVIDIQKAEAQDYCQQMLIAGAPDCAREK